MLATRRCAEGSDSALFSMIFFADKDNTTSTGMRPCAPRLEGQACLMIFRQPLSSPWADGDVRRRNGTQSQPASPLMRGIPFLGTGHASSGRFISGRSQVGQAYIACRHARLHGQRPAPPLSLAEIRPIIFLFLRTRCNGNGIPKCLPFSRLDRFLGLMIIKSHSQNFDDTFL